MHVLAGVSIPSRESLGALAARLTLLIEGFTFQESHRYDEVPAFEAEVGELQFVLMGHPAGETGSYDLSFSGEVDETQLAEREGFIGRFVWRQKASHTNGYHYYSEELAACLIESGFDACTSDGLPNKC